MRFITTILLGTLTAGAAAQEGCHDLRPFFFPIDEFSENKIYRYESQEDPDNSQFWEMSIKIIDDDTILTTIAYGANLEKFEIFRESIGPAGSSMIEFSPIYDGVPVSSEACDVGVYAWSFDSVRSITWCAIYEGPYGPEKIAKTRTCQGMVDNIEFNGKSYRTIKFKDVFTYYIDPEDWTLAYTYSQYSYYCEGLGMIGYERFFEDSERKLWLTEIIDGEDWIETMENIEESMDSWD